MRHRELWFIAFIIEALFMGVGVVFIDDIGSLGLAIAWSITQMPSHAISNWVIAEHFDSNAPFLILTFVLQGTLFGTVFSIIKWAEAKLNPRVGPRKSKAGQRGSGHG